MKPHRKDDLTSAHLDREQQKEISVLIVNYNGRDYLLRALEAIFENISGLDYEVIVVDNGSSDGSVESVREIYPSVKLVPLSHNAGFSRGNNEGARHACGRYLLILNNDTYVPKGTVEQLVSIKKSFPEYGIVAPLVFNPDNSLQVSWGKEMNLFSEIFMKIFAEKWYRLLFKCKRGRLSRNVDWVSGACFLIERDLYQRIQGFDENFFMYKEDVDLGKRLRQLGFKVHLASEARIIHYLRQSTSQATERILKETKRSQLYYYCKHNSRLALRILKAYLILRFRVKLFLYRLKRDPEKGRACEGVLQVIREFACESHS